MPFLPKPFIHLAERSWAIKLKLKTKFISQERLGHSVHVSAHSKYAGITASLFTWLFRYENACFYEFFVFRVFFYVYACLRTHAFVCWEVDLANRYLCGYPVYAACVVRGLSQSFQAVAIWWQPVPMCPCPDQLSQFQSSGPPTCTAAPINTLEFREIKTLLHFRRWITEGAAPELCGGPPAHPHGCSFLPTPSKSPHPTRSHVLPGHRTPRGARPRGHLRLACVHQPCCWGHFFYHLLGKTSSHKSEHF